MHCLWMLMGCFSVCLLEGSVYILCIADIASFLASCGVLNQLYADNYIEAYPFSQGLHTPFTSV